MDVVICLACRLTVCCSCFEKKHKKTEAVNHRLVEKRQNAFDHNFSYQLPVFYFSSDFYKTHEFSKDLYVQRVAEAAIRVLLRNTQAGNPMMLLDQLATEVSNELEFQRERVLRILEVDLECPLINQTTRSFGDLSTFKYYSLSLNNVSVESIVWVLKSIRNDCMQPNESLMFSRFKEYFAIKISMKDWKQLIESLLKSKELMSRFNKFKDVFGEIEIQELEQSNYLLMLRGVQWTHEDASEVRDDDPDYAAFLKFIDQFFHSDSQDKHSKQQEKVKWITSVNTNKNSCSASQENNYKKILQNESITKAIPGGKYGCTLLVKNCGPKILRELSIGRIYALIKQALDKQVIQHLKTHIVKNDSKQSAETQDKEHQIMDLQAKIVRLLREQDNEEVTLAQLPLLLQKKYQQYFNVQALGFPKLKTFLQNMDDKIELARSSNNHIKVSLLPREKDTQSEYRQKHNSDSNCLSENNSEVGPGFRHNLNHVHHERYKHSVGKKQPQSFNQSKASKIDPYGFKDRNEPEITTRQLCELFDKIEKFIMRVVHKSTYGIEASRLEEMLSNFLGYEFVPQQFNSKSFVDFLKSNFANSLEVSPKNSLKPRKPVLLKEYMVYLQKGVASNWGSGQNQAYKLTDSPKSRNQQYGPLHSLSHSDFPANNYYQGGVHSVESKSHKSDQIIEPTMDFKQSRSGIISQKAEDDMDMERFFDNTNGLFCFNSHGNSQIEADNDSIADFEGDENDKHSANDQRKIVNYLFEE